MEHRYTAHASAVNFAQLALYLQKRFQTLVGDYSLPLKWTELFSNLLEKQLIYPPLTYESTLSSPKQSRDEAKADQRDS